MTLRLPQGFSKPGAGEAVHTLIEHEIVGEMASSLGNAGRKVEACMARLHALDRVIDHEARPAAVRAASEAVYAYFVQRELCGFRRHDDIIREFAIPREVLVRLGAR